MLRRLVWVLTHLDVVYLAWRDRRISRTYTKRWNRERQTERRNAIEGVILESRWASWTYQPAKGYHPNQRHQEQP